MCNSITVNFYKKGDDACSGNIAFTGELKVTPEIFKLWEKNQKALCTYNLNYVAKALSISELTINDDEFNHDNVVYFESFKLSSTRIIVLIESDCDIGGEDEYFSDDLEFEPIRQTIRINS